MKWIDSMRSGAAGWFEWKATVEATLDVFCCRGESTHPLGVITAGIHGDEYEGPAAIAELAKQLDPGSMIGSLIAVPVANPAAFRAGTRTNPEDGLNLARSFPGVDDGSPTQQLAYQLFEQLASKADVLIDLHSGGVAYSFLPVAGFYGDPGPDNISFQMARRMGIRHLWQLPATDGVLSCEVWKRGVATIGAEYLGSGQLSRMGVTTYKNGIVSCLQQAGILTGTSESIVESETFTGDWQIADENGIFEALTELGDRVARSALLARITNGRGDTLQVFKAPNDGIVLGLRSKAYVQQGDWAVLLGTSLEPIVE
jgi:predicted deacylase